VISCILYASIDENLSVEHSDVRLILVVSALPYTASFLSVSLVPFQWMSFVRFTKGRDPFGPYVKFYILSSVASTSTTWLLLVLLIWYKIEEAVLIGSLAMGSVSCLLVGAYVYYGLALRRKLLETDSLTGSSMHSKTTKKLRFLAPLQGIMFLGLTGVWITSAVLAYNEEALAVTVPLQLVFEACIMGLTLWMYSNTVQKISGSKASSSGKTGSNSVDRRVRTPSHGAGTLRALDLEGNSQGIRTQKGVNGVISLLWWMLKIANIFEPTDSWFSISPEVTTSRHSSQAKLPKFSHSSQHKLPNFGQDSVKSRKMNGSYDIVTIACSESDTSAIEGTTQTSNSVDSKSPPHLRKLRNFSSTIYVN